jgi:hypothetical protein
MTIRLMRAGVRRFSGFYRAADLMPEPSWDVCTFLPEELIVHLGRGEKGDGDRHHTLYALQGTPQEIATWAENLSRRLRIHEGAFRALNEREL